MTALGAMGAAPVLIALVAAALCGHPLLGASATLNSVLVNSNAIKNLPPPLGGAAPYPCAEDEECGTDEYCASPTRGGAAGVQICLACRKRRKRCVRNAMCCPGNHCKNGICMPSDHNHFNRGEIEETIVESFGNDHSIPDDQSRRTTLPSTIYHTKDTSGPKSVSLSSKKVKCAPSTGRKAPMGWRYSSAVTVEKVCLAGYREITIKPVILRGFIPVRDTKPAIRMQWTSSIESMLQNFS
ncbi:Dickkopf-related protein 1 [Tupaia chinensis]|uniref:Dickkopf-related protein 1 n=1 Tax=Tupaia chinensis TaxID=246437 RepID=L9L346_TUPCH|nr:Dickkopf-related protein 1 [Tupaia chinensis]